MHVGWVGLGSVGTNMVLQVLGAGHTATVYARGSGLAQVEAAGAAVVSDYAALASQCDLLGVCVFSDRQMRDVLLDHGALAAMRPGSIVAIHTTGSPDVTREMGAKAPEGVAVVDATFSGGPDQALAAALTLMVGGDGEALDRARPVFKSYADKIHHVGALGQGQTLKLLNNLMFAANVHYSSAILEIAEKQGFSTWQAARIIQESSGASFAMGMFQGEFPLNRMMEAVRPYLEKDVAAAASSAGEAGIDLAPFAPTTRFFGSA